MRRRATKLLRLRAAYADAGYGHGHRVALLLENRPEMFFHYLALNALGCGIVPVNPDYRHDELAYQMEHSDAELAVAVPERVAALEAVGASAARPLPVVDAGAWPRALPKAPPSPARAPPAWTRSARSSTRPARPAGPRAACSPTSTC